MLSDPYSMIVPIRFMNNTGGNFLASWLHHAKYNITMSLTFSTHGNAHKMPRDADLANVEHSEVTTIEKFLNHVSINKAIEKDKVIYPWFINTHIRSVKFLSSSFAKIINIACTQNDVEDIYAISLGKYRHDTLEILSKAEQDNTIRHHLLDRIRTHGRVEKDNFLNIDFRSELLYGDFHQLASKLGDFLSISKNNFDMNAFKRWQELTQQCVKKFKS